MKPTSSNPSELYPTDSFWAISCYFNPAGYQKRLQNYHTFRKNLNVPLITVELSFDGHYDLEPNAADILLQLSTDSVMWQKERLLNLALTKLPPSCTQFAWLDCDITFEDDNWITKTQEALTHFPIIQPFSKVVEPPPNDLPSTTTRRIRNGVSLAYLLQEKTVMEDLLCGNMRVDYNCNSGLAWAARRQVFENTGFYDACIMGSGNRAMICAAIGQPENGVKSLKMTPAWANNYYQWASKHFDKVQGKICLCPWITHPPLAWRPKKPQIPIPSPGLLDI